MACWVGLGRVGSGRVRRFPKSRELDRVRSRQFSRIGTGQLTRPDQTRSDPTRPDPTLPGLKLCFVFVHRQHFYGV